MKKLSWLLMAATISTLAVLALSANGASADEFRSSATN
jgi:hypothetical protein